MMAEEKFVQVALDDETHRAFKSAAAMAGQTMQEILVALVRKFIAGGAKK